METMFRFLKSVLGAGLLTVSAGCASELPGLNSTDGGFISTIGTGGAAAFGNGGADPAPVGAGGADVGAAGAAPQGNGGVGSGSGGAAYGGSASYGSGGGSALGSGGACVPGSLFCPAATGGAGGAVSTSGGGGVGGAALKCDNAVCWDIFDCAIFHLDLLGCNFTKCEAFVCKQ